MRTTLREFQLDVKLKEPYFSTSYGWHLCEPLDKKVQIKALLKNKRLSRDKPAINQECPAHGVGQRIFSTVCSGMFFHHFPLLLGPGCVKLLRHEQKNGRSLRKD